MENKHPCNIQIHKYSKHSKQGSDIRLSSSMETPWYSINTNSTAGCCIILHQAHHLQEGHRSLGALLLVLVQLICVEFLISFPQEVGILISCLCGITSRQLFIQPCDALLPYGSPWGPFSVFGSPKRSPFSSKVPILSISG